MRKSIVITFVMLMIMLLTLTACNVEGNQNSQGTQDETGSTSENETSDSTGHGTEYTETSKLEDTSEATEQSHSLEYVSPVNAGCIENGHIEYWYCSLCDKYFSDAKANNEITAQSVVVEAVGHNMQSVLSNEFLEIKCSQCGEVSNREVFMQFLDHDEIVYPYIDPVKEYLLAGAFADVSQFDYKQPKQAKEITLRWSRAHIETNDFYIEIATKADFSDAMKTELDDKTTSYGFKFLLKNTKYYVRLTAEIGDSRSCIYTEFTTTDLGPRFLDVGGVYHNCRDLGGYTVGDKIVLQDMFIRGSSPDADGTSHGSNLTNEGAEFLNQVVGIKTQIDLRGSSETHGRTESAFDHASYINIPLTAYEACFSNSQASYYRQVFQILADKNNYPVYLHCAGGADRTGTVAALLLALLGVDKEEIIQDYVVTTFSPVCASQDPRDLATILTVLNGLNAYDGESLAEKCSSYLASIGISKKEIFAIKAIMFGEDPEAYIPETDYGISVPDYCFNTSSQNDITVVLNEDIPVRDVQIDGLPVNFEKNGTEITIKNSSLIVLSDGDHVVTIIFEDTHQSKFVLYVNYYDITGNLQVSNTSEKGDYTYIDIVCNKNIFEGINYHFHTRSDSIYPLVKPNVKINGKTIAEINTEYDLTKYEWTTSPGSTDSRHRVAVSILATGNIMRLLINTEWLNSYVDEGSIEITICGGFEFTFEAQTYKVLSDISYIYENGVWRKV